MGLYFRLFQLVSNVVAGVECNGTRQFTILGNKFGKFSLAQHHLIERPSLECRAKTVSVIFCFNLCQATFLLRNEGFIECGFTTCGISLPTSATSDWPGLSGVSELNIKPFEKTYGILWVMTKRHNANASESVLESKTFFSTSEYAQVPPRAADLFIPLIQQLLQEWDNTFRAAESRLASKVRGSYLVMALYLVNHKTLAHGVTNSEWKRPTPNPRLTR